MDTVGLVTARLARLDFGLCMMLSAAAKWPWLLGATSGWLGYPEGMPLHRLVGWYCVGQSVIHSIAYVVFYFVLYGWIGVWQACFPVLRTNATHIRLHANATKLSSENLNRLGLVNFFGVVAFAVSLVLLIPALDCFRKKYYHVFQCLHLPSALLFILFGALHDLPWINYGIPGLAEWFLGRLCTSVRFSPRKCSYRLPAQAFVLPGTSGPWVELRVDLGKAWKPNRTLSSRGQWASVRILSLGREFHPLSVVMSSTSDGPRLSGWITAKAGDWSMNVAQLARKRSGFEVEILGPFLYADPVPYHYSYHRHARHHCCNILTSNTGLTLDFSADTFTRISPRERPWHKHRGHRQQNKVPLAVTAPPTHHHAHTYTHT